MWFLKYSEWDNKKSRQVQREILLSKTPKIGQRKQAKEEAEGLKQKLKKRGCGFRLVWEEMLD